LLGEGSGGNLLQGTRHRLGEKTSGEGRRHWGESPTRESGSRGVEKWRKDLGGNKEKKKKRDGQTGRVSQR